MTQLTENVYAVEVPDGASNFRIGKTAMLKNNLYYHTKIAYYDGNKVILPPGNWRVLCTTREVKAMHAPALFGYAMLSDHYAQETIKALIASKGLDVNKNYALLKKG